MAKNATKKKQLEDSYQIADNQWQRYVRARDGGHTDYLKAADQCNKFYLGEQWDPALKAKIEKAGKPALTINLVLSTVNAVLGEQSSKRIDFQYKPRNGGTESTGTVLTQLAACIKDANKYDWVESQVFSDGIIQHGRGWFDIRMCFYDHMLGDIEIKSKDPRTILLDPDAKEYDPSTWKETFETRWLSLDEIEATYGKDKMQQVKDLGVNCTRYGTDSIVWGEESFGDASQKDVNSASQNTSDEEDKTVRKVRVIERQHVKLVPVRKFADGKAGDLSRVPQTWDDARVATFAKEHGLYVINQVDKKIRWTVTADKIVLHDDWSPYATFTLIPYFCYFRRGRPFGMVTNLISPQEQLNKLSSQELHILNTTANSGWMIQTGSLVGMTVDELRNRGAETGVVLEYRKGAEKPEKIQPNTAPTGIDHAAMKSAGFIKEISGVNEAMLGMDGPEVSGVALEQKSFRGQIQMQVPFDNLTRTRFMVGGKIVELVQQFYTSERVFTNSTSGIDYKNEDNQQFVINQMNASGEIINDLTVGKYKVTLASMPARDSFDDEQFAEAINLRNIGVAIPDDRIIEYSHLARKAELAEEVRQMTGRGHKSEEQIQMEQFQQQITMRLAMAEVANAEAEVSKIEAETMLAQAEAQLKAGGMDSPEIQIQLEALANKLAVARENLVLRRDLAQLSARASLDNNVLSTKGRLVEGTVKEREKRHTALLVGAQTARLKPPPSKSK